MFTTAGKTFAIASTAGSEAGSFCAESEAAASAQINAVQICLLISRLLRAAKQFRRACRVGGPGKLRRFGSGQVRPSCACSIFAVCRSTPTLSLARCLSGPRRARPVQGLHAVLLG